MEQILIDLIMEILARFNPAEFLANLDYQKIGTDIFILVVVFILVYAIMSAIKYIASHWLIRLFSKTKTHIDDVIGETLSSLNFLFSLGVSILIWESFVELDQWLSVFSRVASLSVVFFFGVLTLSKIINSIIDEILVDHESTDDKKDKFSEDLGLPKVDETVSSFIKISVTVLLWVVAFLILIQNFGYNVTALLGGLGIAGLAIGFAIQSILKDIISFFTIYFDKPFQPGDFIITKDDKGTVQNIGVKSTQIKTLKGQLLVIPNTELVSSRINNYGAMDHRRIEINFGVLYETPKDKLKQIPKMVEKIVSNTENVKFGRCHHKFFGESAMEYQLVYTVQTGSYEEYMDRRQEINFAMMDKFEEEGIEFAYPTQKVFSKILD